MCVCVSYDNVFIHTFCCLYYGEHIAGEEYSQMTRMNAIQCSSLAQYNLRTQVTKAHIDKTSSVLTTHWCRDVFEPFDKLCLPTHLIFYL